MPIVVTERFARAYARLLPRVQRWVDKALILLDDDFRHPSVRAKPIEGAAGIYEARVDQGYCMTYERDGDRFVMRNVGQHDKTLANP